ncbi:MAG: hypothetical protein WAT92_16360 [Saprospiraceae bacterium]
MNVIRNTIILILFPILFYNCDGSRYHMVDDFGVQLSSSGKSWEFYSKLGCSNNPKAFNVKSVQWNENIIIISNENKSNKIEFYIIYSQNQMLKSCYIDNLVLGPLTNDEVKTFKVKYKIGDLKEKSFNIRIR